MGGVPIGVIRVERRQRRRRRREKRLIARIIVSTCMWMVLLLLAAAKFSLLPLPLQNAIEYGIGHNVIWFIVALTAVGVFLTCADFRAWQKRKRLINLIEILRSVLIIALAADWLFSIALH